MSIQIASPHLLAILISVHLGLNYPITNMADQLVEETLRYGPHSLQTITVATVPNGLPTGLWVVYVHTQNRQSINQTNIILT